MGTVVRRILRSHTQLILTVHLQIFNRNPVRMHMPPQLQNAFDDRANSAMEYHKTHTLLTQQAAELYHRRQTYEKLWEEWCTGRGPGSAEGDDAEYEDEDEDEDEDEGHGRDVGKPDLLSTPKSSPRTL
jgi:hypothetical protein